MKTLVCRLELTKKWSKGKGEYLMKRWSNLWGLAKPNRGKVASPSVRKLALLCLVPIAVICQVLYADDSPAIMRVEQDWEVVLNEPDLQLDAPQFHTILSPCGNLDSYYLMVCWNYREQVDFASGGMQLLAYNGENLIGKKSYREDKLSTAAETISWTQVARTNGSVLSFEIANGSSTTWGAFGGSDTNLSGEVGVANLNGYSTSVSSANSWVSYGANRVNVLRIKEVRYYDAADNLISRDSEPKIVYQLEQ